MKEACTIIQSAAHEDANIIFGAVLDEKMKDEVKITVIATGFKEQAARRHDRVSAASLRFRIRERRRLCAADDQSSARDSHGNVSS